MAAQDHRRTLWIASAPAGVWTSGPSVIYDYPGARARIQEYQDMGWTVEGPYKCEQVTLDEPLSRR